MSCCLPRGWSLLRAKGVFERQKALLPHTQQYHQELEAADDTHCAVDCNYIGYCKTNLSLHSTLVIVIHWDLVAN